MINTMLIPLKTLMDQDMTATDEVISSFIYPADPDIEGFLKTRAIKFENALKSRTYLLFDKEAAHKGELSLLAYFTIALHILIVPEGFSGNRVKKLDGFSSTFCPTGRCPFHPTPQGGGFSGASSINRYPR
ncbi:hypothetical protein [Desulfoscipio gibsoniae]|uniref:Uncharacterized protein n=1 Tax=Desulfoscipio gibsoniae DSM 7213 TaxID=767817 RepID=R4KU71_9FIRM|nr:hypothetical protein [Desulfoscipio gibsoniae]AGL03166.1 hypothetical protein Desgi_3856 [Desulfoscipio gibsoniae DSM 7213]